MSATTNYGLYLTDDSSTRFHDWREMINGTNESNMVKIDRVLGQKADNSIPIELVLLAAGWSGSSAPYTQTITVEQMTADHNGSIAVSQNANMDERTAAREAFLAVTGQENGKLTISADGKLPDIDIPVTLLLIG